MLNNNTADVHLAPPMATQDYQTFESVDAEYCHVLSGSGD